MGKSWRRKVVIEREIIEKLYIEEKRTIKEISEILDFAPYIISRNLKEYNIPITMSGTMQTIDITGQRFGSLVAIKGYRKNKTTCWLCQCDCGNIHESGYNVLVSGGIKRCYACKFEQKILWTVFKQWVEGAQVRGIEFDISVDDAYDLYLKQDCRCALSGVPIDFGKTVKEHKSGKTTASMDRIDSSKHYTIDNIQWVHKYINLMKQKYSQEHFIEMCENVSNYQKEKRGDV